MIYNAKIPEVMLISFLVFRCESPIYNSSHPVFYIFFWPARGPGCLSLYLQHFNFLYFKGAWMSFLIFRCNNSSYYHSYATFHGTNVPRLLLWLVVVCLSPLSNYIFQRILSISWQNYAVGVLFLIFSYLYLSKGVNRRASFYSKKIATKCHVSSLPHGNSLLPC